MEKVTPFQRVVPSVAISSRQVKICQPRIERGLHLLDMLPNLAEFRVPLNSAPIGIDSCRTKQASICLGSWGFSPDQSRRLCWRNQAPFGTTLVPALMFRANCMDNLQWTQGSTSRFTRYQEVEVNARKNASLSHNVLVPLFHPG